MNDDSLRDDVIATIRAAAKLPATRRIAPESRLVEDLGIDSLDLVGVLLAVQDRFDVVIDDAAINELKRVEDVIDHLIRERGGVSAKR